GNMILAGEHESEHPFAVAADDEGGPILALRVVLFERDPPPDDLTGVGISVEVGGVADRDRTLVVAGIGGTGPARLRVGPRLLRRLPRCLGGPLSTVIRSLPASGLPLRLRLTQIAQALADSDSGCPIDQWFPVHGLSLIEAAEIARDRTPSGEGDRRLDGEMIGRVRPADIERVDR